MLIGVGLRMATFIVLHLLLIGGAMQLASNADNLISEVTTASRE